MENTVTMKTTRLRSAAGTHLDVEGVIWLQVQLKQFVAKVGFLAVASLATDAILGTACIDDNINETCPRQEKLIPIGSRPIAIKRYEDASMFTVKINEGTIAAEDGKGYPCTTVRWRKIPAVSEAYIYVKTNAQDVQMVGTPVNLFESRHLLVAHGRAKAIRNQPFVVEVASWSCKTIEIPNCMKVAIC